MKSAVLALVALFSLMLGKSFATASSVFRFHLAAEPLTLDPTQMRGSGAMFLLNSLMLPLFHSDLGQSFKPAILRDCLWKQKTLLSCRLTPNTRWSNGEPITAEQIQRSFQYFQDPKTAAVRSDLTENIKRVGAPKKDQVEFELQSPDPRFQERLTSPLLTPLYSTVVPKPTDAHTLITSGPYQIEKWESKNKIRLRPNPHFRGHPQRPPIEIFFLPEDTSALMLYEKGQLDFLRRVPTAYLTRYESKPDFHQAPVSRFDYVGFGPELADQAVLREALSRSLAYQDWALLLKARGRPGCYGIGLDLLKADPCLEYDSKQISQWRKQISAMKYPALQLHYSSLGGEDHKRSMEWLQSEWKKQLGIKVSVRGLDNALFQKEMNEKPAPLFRFGVTLEHLSCYSALRTFAQNPKYPLPFKTSEFNKLLTALSSASKPETEAQLCEKALGYLLEHHWIIPLGRIHTSYLLRPSWKGLRLSALNYLDLSQLHEEDSAPKKK